MVKMVIFLGGGGGGGRWLKHIIFGSCGYEVRVLWIRTSTRG